jgi:hypothetical protein
MAVGTPPRDAPPGVSPARATTPGASPGARAPDATPPSAVPETPPERFGSPDAAGALAPGGASPTIRGDKFAPVSPQSAGSPASPHLTQGAPGHVARVVDWAEREAQGELLSSSQKRSDRNRRSKSGSLTSSVVGGFAAATSGALERLRASRNAPETPVMPPKTRRSLRDALPEEQEEEIALARRMSPLALDDPFPPTLDPSSTSATRASDAGKNLSADLVEVTVDPYDFDAFAEEVEKATVARKSSPAPPPIGSPDDSSAVPETPESFAPADDDAREAVSPTPSPSAGPAIASSPALDEPASLGNREEATRGSESSAEDRRADEEARARAQIVAAAAATSVSPVSRVDANAREAVVIVAETDERAKENAEGDDGANGGSGGGPVPRVFPLRPSDLASNAYRVTESRAAMLLPKRSAAPVPAPSAQKKHKARNLANDAKKTGGHDGLTAVMTPLPISKSVLDRIDALGPEMQPAQKYILLLGIALDFYAKTQLIRELRRFALMGDNGGWGWFAAVFLFFLLSGSATTAYWLLHYPMPTPREIEELSGKNATRVFGFTKLDFKKMVRTAGAVASMCQLGTAFAAWRALRVKDLRQRKAEMDLRGMQLVDTVFLLLPVATLQAYVGMKCSSPELVCPGRSGFDTLLFLAVLGAITSATLCFVSLDLHEKPPSLTWKQYWRAHKAHLSETVAKSAFRFLELSARVSLIALFSAVKGGWVFFVFFMHAVLVLIALRFWPRVVGGGVPDRGVWKKLVAVERVIVSPKRKWWPERLFKGRVVYLPTLDDSKLLVATMIWPPSMFVANATDKKGRFWWRSKTCPRKSFLSVDRRDAIFPLPLFAALQVFEACLMFLIVGFAIGNKPHYHTYFLCAALVNLAWLMAVVAWISAAALWNPFLPEGPPLAAKKARRAGAPGTADAEDASASADDDDAYASEWKGWHGPDAAAGDDDDDDDGSRAGAGTFHKGANVAASMAAPGVFSPGGRTPGGRASRRASNGVAASYAIGPTMQSRVENQPTLPLPREEEVFVAPVPAARALLFGGDKPADAETRKAEEDAAEKAKAAETAAAARLESERLERERSKAARAEAARLEIARLDALRREEAARAMRREKELLEEKLEKERATRAARPPAHRPPVLAAAKPEEQTKVVFGETEETVETTASHAGRRQSGGLFGRPGIVVSSSVSRADEEM